MSYEANRGQFDHRIAFVAHAGRSMLALTDHGALLAVPEPRSAHDRFATPRARGGAPRDSGRAGLPGAARAASAPRVSYRTLGLSLDGAGAGLHPAATGPLPGRVNYLIGKDRSRWHTNIPTYSGATYRRAWPGIDVRFSGVQRQLEYAFTLSPGAEARRIALRLSGARSLQLTPGGELLARLPGGATVRELAPHAYQTAPDGSRVIVASRYLLTAHGVVRFVLGAYDRHRTLTIDPSVTLAYSTYLGGTGDDRGNGIAVDSAGAAYVTGYTDGGFRSHPARTRRHPAAATRS